MTRPAAELRERFIESWERFTTRLEGVDPDSVTRAGWTVKEMTGHVAFWLETVPPFVTGMWRGDAAAFELTFPSGYRPADDAEWPRADVHNAREAAWARGRPFDEVRRRLDAAGAALIAFLGTVTDAEVSEHAEYFAEQPDHLDEHGAELAASGERETTST